ncbi:hypothetical protein [Yersinia kristensenii]|uniref:hypothetical protein n=1 Tax=Yersinia kristensenii TaxID=28152 RepID=UPI0001A542A8|nr:hypothetical protein [Yersinia kristensenii]EEP89022.1 hypothetical protein ykris0001_46740 [Yersinia kristensenii ATCC 33638]PEH52775.1 hypothetical protein CRM81_05080 [Yersinia kristensenii]SUP70631.1 Uncharacterised protein [Yersinia kristensenii]
MDVNNELMECNIKTMRRVFNSCFDFSFMDINYSIIDIDRKIILTLPSNYEWHLIYWHDNLDLHISERIIPGIQHWCNYSSCHGETLSKSGKKETKVDICTQSGSVFEIMSVNADRKLSTAETLAILKYKPVISDFARKLWKPPKQQSVILPIREQISYPNPKMEDEHEDALNSHPYMRFGEIVFTRKEMITIRHLLSHRRIKEIAAIQGCSLSVEQQRIHRIKEKVNCQNQPLSALFNALKLHGVTLSCLDIFITYP